MKRLLAVLTVATLLAAATTAQAVTITFSGDSLIQQYSTYNTGDTRALQAQPRALQDPIGTTIWSTYSNATSQGNYATWVSSLGAGEGISCFDLWLQGGMAGVTGWGENVVETWGTTLTATAPTGWSVQLTPSDQIYGGVAAGFTQMRFYTTNPAYYINNVSTVGNFSFTADLQYASSTDYWPHTADGTVHAGDPVRFWFGLENDDVAPANVALTYDAYSLGGASTGTSAMQGVISVPEPSTVVLCVVGMLSLLGFRVWRKR
jgi:hypothetical protein